MAKANCYYTEAVFINFMSGIMLRSPLEVT